MYRVHAAQQPVADRQIGRDRLSRMGKLFIAILLIAIFEGAIRKWVSSASTIPLVLLRDALALYGIAIGLKKRRVSSSHIGMQLLLIWSGTVVCWGLLQLIVNQTSVLIYFLGLRFWLLYLWFAYAGAKSLSETDFRFISKVLIIISIAMVPLVVVQHLLPPGAFLNRQVDGDEETVFRITADIVRTTGTFSFTLGYTVFLAMVAPFAFASFTPGMRLWRGKALPILGVTAMGVGSLVSGSRAAIIFFGLLFTIYIFTSLFFARGRKNKRSALRMALIALVAVSTLPFLFSRAIDASQERFETAAESESFVARISSMFLGEPGVYKDLPLLGHGLGGGTNLAGFAVTGHRTFLLAETEVARTVLEGGLLGVAFVALKLGVVLVGLRKSFTIARGSGNILPGMLWATTAIALLSWSIIGQLTVNVLGSLLLGLSVASLRLPLHTSRE